VRSVLDADLLPVETIHYTPYGTGAPTESLFGFTGEPTDANGLVHLRARYYDPALGVFPSLDPVEGNPSQPLSLARYAYVQGNPVNAVDPSGMIMEDPNLYGGCQGGTGDGYFNIQPPGTRACPQGYRAVPIERCINSPNINISTEAAGTCDGNPAIPGIQNELFDPQNPNRNAGLYGPRVTCCQSLTDGSYNYDCSLATVGSRSRDDAAIYDLLDSVEENAGISGTREAFRCLESGEALANLRDGYNATGSIVGFEATVFLPILPIGPSVGFGAINLTDGRQCHSFLTREYGIGTGFDGSQVASGFMYTTAQLHSRQIVGLAMADHMRTELVETALDMALQQRCPAPGGLHHSDRGSQYTSHAYQQRLRQAGFTISMSRTGNCLDNAPMESFWATLKRECADVVFVSRHHARTTIFGYIMSFYNRRRKHSALDYHSPVEFEQYQQGELLAPLN
jgi:RHS repeat-associated protein